MKINRKIFKEFGLVAIGLSVGSGMTFVLGSSLIKSKDSQFSVQMKDNDVLIQLRGRPIVRLKDQGTHYKFFATGETTPWQRAIVFGSVDTHGLVSLTWQNTSETDTMIWTWQSEDRTIVTAKRPESLRVGDVFVDQGFGK